MLQRLPELEPEPRQPVAVEVRRKGFSRQRTLLRTPQRRIGLRFDGKHSSRNTGRVRMRELGGPKETLSDATKQQPLVGSPRRLPRPRHRFQVGRQHASCRLEPLVVWRLWPSLQEELQRFCGRVDRADLENLLEEENEVDSANRTPTQVQVGTRAVSDGILGGYPEMAHWVNPLLYRV